MEEGEGVRRGCERNMIKIGKLIIGGKGLVNV